MSTPDDIARVYALDLTPPVQVPTWATLPLHTTGSGRVLADGWSVLVISDSYCGPERRKVPRDPVLVAHGARVLPRADGFLFGARAR
jgi:hypothetical protein